MVQINIRMKLPKAKNKRGRLFIALAILLVAVGAGSYIFIVKPFNKNAGTGTNTPVAERTVNDINYSPATNDEKKDADQAKQNIANQNNQQPTPSTSITVTVTRASQAGAGQPLNIRTLVSGATSGNCTATLTNANKTINQSGTLVQNVNAYTCNIDVPAASFTTGGTWKLSVVATSGQQTSTAATQDVTITK